MAKTNQIIKQKIAVLGAGHGGLAMAGHLALMGHTVNLFNRGEERLWGVRSSGTIEVIGEAEGFGKVNMATTSMKEAIKGIELIMVVVPANGHKWIAEQIAPHLVDGQIIVLHPGRTFGALEFKQVLSANNVTADVIVCEAQTFIYASRATGPSQVRIFRIKNSIPVASVRAHLIPKVIKKMRQFYPQFVPGDNILKTSFENIGSVFHPALCILNAGWIEHDIDFQFYHEGASRSVTNVLEKIDEERVAVAEALGIRAITARQWLYMAYSSAGKTLFEAMRKNPGYRGINAPKTLKMRYLEEDIPYSLVPIASVGRMFKVKTPTINSLIQLGSQINACNYWSIGRTVESLGISGMSMRDLRLLAIGEPIQGS
ncbi:MAG TPA: NAD/NADP octopine/nopaline dehydrogenase family protein [Bacteroidales bacterium]|nr:NAD/NADP octopine/nopaline dehydrogenase family protein [Bacteroidales bacterium]